MKIIVSERFLILALTILFLIVTSLSIWLNGYQAFGDAFRYLEYAENLKKGFYIERHNIRYVVYVVFIFLVEKLPINDLILTIVLFQYLISGIATIFLYKASKTLFDKVESAGITTAIYILFVEIIFWNSYVLCESLYLSLTCIAIYFLVKFYRITTYKNAIVVLLFIFLLALIKPTGIAFGLALISTLFFYFQRNLRRSYTIILLALCLIGSLVLTNKYLDTYKVIDNYQTGEVISGVSTVKHIKGVENYLISVPENLKVLDESYPKLVRISHFALANFPYWLKFTATKVFYMVAHVRPLWSIFHNIYNGLFLLICYVLYGMSLINKSVYFEIKWFSGFYFLTHIIGVGITAADWDGRFLMPLLPILFILVGYQFETERKRFFKLKNRVTNILPKNYIF